MSVLLHLVIILCEKDMERALLPYELQDRSEMPVTGRAIDYHANQVVDWHHHPNAQLLHAVHGVMVVSTEVGQWIVPPTRGIWVPAGVRHSSRILGEVHMRSVYIRPDAASNLPTECKAVGISPLLRELILEAVCIPQPYTPDSRDGRLMRLLLDEVCVLPTLPLHLPQPTDMRLLKICDVINKRPYDDSTMAQWADRLGIDVKTIQRLFVRETGMNFGQWRQQARLLVALEQLAGGLKIVDVALNLGYASPGAFATMFKRQFGVAPSDFFTGTGNPPTSNAN
jgi:AraC-like DNA-binding protein/mannose-6-phosphate isomerase-like protein (cupin superfamily)